MLKHEFRKRDIKSINRIFFTWMNVVFFTRDTVNRWRKHKIFLTRLKGKILTVTCNELKLWSVESLESKTSWYCCDQEHFLVLTMQDIVKTRVMTRRKRENQLCGLKDTHPGNTQNYSVMRLLQLQYLHVIHKSTAFVSGKLL